MARRKSRKEAPEEKADTIAIDPQSALASMFAGDELDVSMYPAHIARGLRALNSFPEHNLARFRHHPEIRAALDWYERD